MQSYHFLEADMTTYNGKEPAWTVGETRTMKGKVAMCGRGYHASPTLFDALKYASGPVACIVELGDPVVWQEDKGVSLSRKLAKACNVERELRLYAADCAEHVAHLYTCKTKWQPAQTIEVVRRFANGQATADELAEAAAWAAGAASGAATWAAAWAAWAAGAASGAAWASGTVWAVAEAASGAAWAAVEAASGAATWAAAEAAEAAEATWQRQRFDETVLAALMKGGQP